MKVLLYSYVFAPSVGGIEVVSETIARNLITLGYECVVVTETSNDKEDAIFPFRIIRQPSLGERLKWIRWADVVHANGASMALFWYSKLLSKPFVWTHGGYQLLCIDGLGWVDGVVSPLEPIQSFHFHKKKSGLKRACIGYAKLLLRRFCGQKVDLNIAVTHWVANRQPLPNQIVIYNPFPITRFKTARQNIPTEYDFVFLGRLVSEKGVGTLLNAFAILLNEEPNSTLALIGDGNWREQLEMIVEEKGIKSNVYFLGRKTGNDIIEIVEKSKIAVVPSEWEEPMGGVAVEMLAAGKNIIVSEKGGLAECIGQAGLTFKNGDAQDLSLKLKRLLCNTTLQSQHKAIASQHILNFDEVELTKQYVAAYQSIL